jgi:4-carboxymuconolactone decarboxylase
MARIPYVDPDDAPEPVASALRGNPSLRLFQLVAHAETVFRPWLRYSGALLQDLELDPLLRELAILRVAALTPGAEYEWVQHESIARSVGAGDGEIAAARSGQGLEGDAALVVRFTEQVVRDAAPDDATFAAARERLSSRQIVELLLVIGQYMALGRVMASLRIDVDDALPPSERATLLGDDDR